MTYQVLARKWRPKTFSDMAGQEHVLQTLIHALNNNRLHHAYLFTGTRGVGKTTIARIFAKCLNCEQGVGSTPCGKCASCIEIAEGRFIDLIEVDAASKTHEQVTITKNGTPVAVLIGMDEWESLQETLFWLSQPGIRESNGEAIADVAAGRVLTQEQIRAEFNAPTDER